jgi:uncharacterized glyoxalase superfamily protein PhnB
MSASYIPEGHRTVTPFVITTGAARMLAFAKEAFGAADVHPPHLYPDGAVRHAQIRIGDSTIMVTDARNPKPTAAIASFYVYVEDTDATYRRALQAGGTSLMEPADQFYGDRNAGVKDPCGNEWWIATHLRDVSEEEIAKLAAGRDEHG